MLVVAGEWWEDVLLEHVEELELLWNRRQLALRDPGWTGAALAQLDGRIEAHTDALELAGEEAYDALRPALAGTSAAQVLAAALPLLRMRTDEARGMVEAAAVSLEGEAREGVGLALCYAPLDAGAELAQRMLAAQAELVVALAVRALAFHGQPRTAEIVPLLRSPDPAVRHLAWETVSLLGPRTRVAPGAEGLAIDLRNALRAALEDASPLVREAAWMAAAWTRQPWLPDALRDVTADAGAAPLVRRLRAILARQADFAAVRAMASEALPLERMALLASLGSPASVPEILGEVQSDSPAMAAAAGAAFRRITGVDVRSGARVALDEPPDEDEIAALFAPEVELPDPDHAVAAWSKLEARLSSLARCTCGLDASRVFTPAEQQQLDRESLFEWALRGTFEGLVQCSPADLDRFARGSAAAH